MCTYWFTSALVIAELVILIMLLTRGKNILYYMIGSCFFTLLGYYMVDNNLSIFYRNPSFPWLYKNSCFAILFISIGGLYWKIEKTIDNLLNWKVLIGLIGLFCALLLLYQKNFRVLISTLDVNVNGIVISLLSILILIKLCQMIKKNKFLNYVGQNSIGFYFMSGALPIVLSLAVHKFMSESTFLGFLIVFVGSVIIASMVVYLLNRYLSFVFDLRKIWRK